MILTFVSGDEHCKHVSPSPSRHVRSKHMFMSLLQFLLLLLCPGYQTEKGSGTQRGNTEPDQICPLENSFGLILSASENSAECGLLC